MGQLAALNKSDVTSAYRRMAPVYDLTFGKITEAAQRQTIRRANQFSGKLLEIGVGTGLSLPHYHAGLTVSGIDLSPHMLKRARERVDRDGLANVDALLEMDASELEFADASFDVVVGLYVMTVVPDPSQVLREMARVTRPGGAVLICNHFSAGNGVRGAVEKHLAGFADILGFRTEFPLAALPVPDTLRQARKTELNPFGFFTLLEFVRTA